MTRACFFMGCPDREAFGYDCPGGTYAISLDHPTLAGTALGVAGFAPNNAASAYGVIGQCTSPTSYGVFASGNLGASGTKSFRIDHPADPANKYLVHYSTEAPEPINFYSGNIVTDERGYAVVQLPPYFQAINRDFRYQLTPIGDFAQVIVAREIDNNRFTIRTDKPRIKVSWRLEAIRNDAWVRQYGYRDVVEKVGREKGTYLAPELYGMPESMATFQANPSPANTNRPNQP